MKKAKTPKRPRDLSYSFYAAEIKECVVDGKIHREVFGGFNFSSAHTGEVRNMIRYLTAFADWAESKEKRAK